MSGYALRLNEMKMFYLFRSCFCSQRVPDFRVSRGPFFFLSTRCWHNSRALYDSFFFLKFFLSFTASKLGEAIPKKNKYGYLCQTRWISSSPFVTHYNQLMVTLSFHFLAMIASIGETRLETMLCVSQIRMT